jgi:hypothetical protein
MSDSAILRQERQSGTVERLNGAYMPMKAYAPLVEIRCAQIL